MRALVLTLPSEFDQAALAETASVRGFSAEEDMLPVVASAFRNMLLVAELPLEHGRPDLLALTPSGKEYASRLAQTGHKALSTPALRVLQEVSVRGTPVRQLGVEHNMSASTVLKHLASLRAFGYIRVVDDVAFIERPYAAPFTEIHAIELKLSNWTKAAEQASLHRVFADRVSIAIDASFIHRVDCASLRSAGIGLFEVGDESRFYEIVPPRRQLPNDLVLRRSVMERAWSEGIRQGALSRPFLGSDPWDFSPATYLGFGS